MKIVCFQGTQREIDISHSSSIRLHLQGVLHCKKESKQWHGKSIVSHAKMQRRIKSQNAAVAVKMLENQAKSELSWIFSSSCP
ncbi:hypothetical protein QN277_007013 [Acacia crassicarpa]|uniref:Uncharacterized protein n=1 Tax=Acacia crassicarpa TaxID=499986 RepID=A0AAE1JTM7_9FABA|nr:hypothetical protein QN277_007013 [Acacia crassicarpa]